MGAVFALFAAFYFWTPKIVGKTYNEFLGKIHFWTLFVGVNLVIIFNNIIIFDNGFLYIKYTLESIMCELSILDIKLNKSNIRSKIKGKAGIYMVYNKITGDSYVGSSINLYARFNAHLNLIAASELPLYRAIRKYGLNNFAFIVLQYCEPSVEVCIGLEQYYLDLYKPAYNILKTASSSEGFNHTPETIQKLQAIHKGKLHPRFGTIPSLEQRLATSKALKAHFLAKGHHNKGKKGILASQFGIGGTKIHMYSSNGQYECFPSINAARQFFHVRFTTISNNIDTGQPIFIKGIEWIITSTER